MVLVVAIFLSTTFLEFRFIPPTSLASLSQPKVCGTCCFWNQPSHKGFAKSHGRTNEHGPGRINGQGSRGTRKKVVRQANKQELGGRRTSKGWDTQTRKGWNAHRLPPPIANQFLLWMSSPVDAKPDDAFTPRLTAFLRLPCTITTIPPPDSSTRLLSPLANLFFFPTLSTLRITFLPPSIHAHFLRPSSPICLLQLAAHTFAFPQWACLHIP